MLQTISRGILISWWEYLFTSKQVLREQLFPSKQLLGNTFFQGVLINGCTGSEITTRIYRSVRIFIDSFFFRSFCPSICLYKYNCKCQSNLRTNLPLRPWKCLKPNRFPRLIKRLIGILSEITFICFCLQRKWKFNIISSGSAGFCLFPIFTLPLPSFLAVNIDGRREPLFLITFFFHLIKLFTIIQIHYY